MQLALPLIILAAITHLYFLLNFIYLFCKSYLKRKCDSFVIIKDIFYCNMAIILSYSKEYYIKAKLGERKNILIKKQ